MSYTKHEFKSGDKLFATQLNEMDAQIYKNHTDIANHSENISALNDKVIGLSQLEAPKIVMSLDEMTDTSKHYVLDNYIYAWMRGEDEISPNFNNLADPTNEGWKTGYRINSSYQYAVSEANQCSQFIPFTPGDIIRLKGIYLLTTGLPTAENGYAYTRFITSNDGSTITGSVQISTAAPESTVVENGIETIDTSKIDGLLGDTHFIICGVVEDPNNVIITVNEEITYTTNTTYKWKNTGINYTSTIYTDIVGVLSENNVIYLSDNNLPSGQYTLKYQNNDYAPIGTYVIE